MKVSAAIGLLAAVSLVHGTLTAGSDLSLRTECADPGSWKIELLKSAESTAERAVYTVRLTSDRPATPPEFDAFFFGEPRGAHNLWQPIEESMARHRLYASEWGATRYVSELGINEPICSVFDEKEMNSLTIACSEPMRRVAYAITCHSTDARLEARFRFFTRYEAPMTEYSVKILLDRRRVFWADAVREGSAWIAASSGFKPCRVPSAARDPFYSTWYAFWQDVRDDDVVREIREAASLGVTGAILDDGWQKETSKSYYSATGDWLPAAGRFPDMRAHVDRVHAAGIRNYLLWLSVPFVGCESAAYARFKGKFLKGDGQNVAVLDPRFPEVRQYLLETYVRCVKDWDFDGLKLDFIDAMVTDDDPGVRDGYAGRDCKTVPEGIDRLMTEVHSRLAEIKPDVLIEFRQRYTGPAIRRYGNLLRATDCPYDLIGNRKRIADLRLTSGETAVHSDMLVWSPEDTPEDAARVILNAIFGTVQYSLRLSKLSAEQREVVRHWIGFSLKYREVLQQGRFRPHHPELMYPLIESETKGVRLFAVYADNQLVPVGNDPREVVVINATASGSLVLDCPSAVRAGIYDTFGRSVRVEDLPPGLVRITCPPSGYARFERLKAK